MEQVREEAGVSAGLMYRYFPSKDDMLRAAISGSMLQFEALITEVGSNEKATTAAGYLRLLLDTLRRFRRHTEGVDLFTLAIQGWRTPRRAHRQRRSSPKALRANWSHIDPRHDDGQRAQSRRQRLRRSQPQSSVTWSKARSATPRSTSPDTATA